MPTVLHTLNQLVFRVRYIKEPSTDRCGNACLMSGAASSGINGSLVTAAPSDSTPSEHWRRTTTQTTGAVKRVPLDTARLNVCADAQWLALAAPPGPSRRRTAHSRLSGLRVALSSHFDFRFRPADRPQFGCAGCPRCQLSARSAPQARRRSDLAASDSDSD